MVEALGAGDVAKAIELFTPELCPRSCRSPARRRSASRRSSADIEPAGINHMILALTDAHLVEFFSGQKVENVPDINGQLRLVAERVVPAFA